jgi:hypothetical protein
MKCIIKTASLISICSFAFSCSVFAEAQSKDYFNQSHVPVALTVPYYDQSDNALTNLDIILQPGDVYQPSDHEENGIFVFNIEVTNEDNKKDQVRFFLNIEKADPSVIKMGNGYYYQP